MRLLLVLLLLTAAAAADTGGFREVYPDVKHGVVLLVGDLGRGRVATGTGFVVAPHPKGSLVLTNAHVVSGIRRLQATVDNSRRVSGEVLARNATHDLALCRISESGLPVLQWSGNPSSEGTEVAVVGYPLTEQFLGAGMDVTATVTRGIISARRTKGQTELYQVDADVNPGNSGGPVFDWETGAVLGVAVAKMGHASGLNFAIPEEIALEFLRAQGVEPQVLGSRAPAPNPSPTPSPSQRPEAVPGERSGSGATPSERPGPRTRPALTPTTRTVKPPPPAPVKAPRFPWEVVLALGALALVTTAGVAAVMFRRPSSDSEVAAHSDDIEL